MKRARATTAVGLLAGSLLLGGAALAVAAPATLTGAGGGRFGPGVVYDGVPLSAQRFGLGVDIASDGRASGDVQVTLLTAALAGAPARITIEGTPVSGAVGSGGQAAVSGVCTVTVAGKPSLPDVPFSLAIGRTTTGRPAIALTVGTAQLPAVEVSEGRVTVR